MATRDSHTSAPVDVHVLREQVEHNPSDAPLAAKYFWALHQHMKSSLDSGTLDEAVAAVTEMGRCQPHTDKALNAIGWGIHKILRAIKESSAASAMDSPLMPALLQAYQNVLALQPGPDKMHSAVLWTATQMQGEEPFPWYCPLLRAIGFERLVPEDFEGKEVGGYTLPSLVERAVVIAARQVRTAPATDDAAWLLQQLETLQKRKPQNNWLRFSTAQLLDAADRREEARNMLKCHLQGKRTDYLAWLALGESFLADNPAASLGCCCKAATLRDDDSVLLPVREVMVRALVALGRTAEARAELEKVVATKLAKGLPFTAYMRSAMDEPWYRAVGTPAAVSYRAESFAVDALLFDDVVSHVGIVTNIDEKSRSCYLAYRLDGSARFRYHRTPWEKDLPAPGAPMLVYMRSGETTRTRCDAIALQPAVEFPVCPFARKFSGPAKVIIKPGKEAIAFVGDVFIPSTLLKAVPSTEAAVMCGVAVKEMNRARGEYGWRAITLHTEDPGAGADGFAAES